MNNKEIVLVANMLSDKCIHDFSAGCEMMRDCIAQYGPKLSIVIGRLAELYFKVKRGALDRDEATKLQNQILREV